MQIGQVILEERRRRGLTCKQFAKAVGVTRGAVQQWEHPNGTTPSRHNTWRVAAFLNLSMDELVTGRRSARPELVKQWCQVVSFSVAAIMTTLANYQQSSIGSETVSVPVPVGPRTYACRVPDDSMAALTGDSFTAGTVVVIEPDLHPVPGDYIIALAAKGEAVIRQLVVDGGETYLYPLNRRYPVESIDGRKVVGVVRAIVRRFR